LASELDRQKVSFEELAHSNTLALNALVNLLDEKGVLQKRAMPHALALAKIISSHRTKSMTTWDHGTKLWAARSQIR